MRICCYDLNLAMDKRGREKRMSPTDWENLEEVEMEHKRCYPSIWGWGGVMFLLAYFIFMHSFHFTNHPERSDIGKVQDDMLSLDEKIEKVEARLAILEPQVNGVVSYIAA